MDVLPVIIAAFANLIIGWIWFGPAFGEPWMKILKLKKKDTKPNPWVMFFGLLFGLLMFTILSYFIDIFALSSIGQAIALGVLIWLGFMVPKDISPVLWEQKPFRLFLIYSGYSLISTLVGAIILVLW